ncbi:TPA: MobQ family relaxase, partial [Klebsiella variicola subsp. variicola]
MAIFHLNFKILNRCKDGKSKSSLYLSAYNSRQRLTDEKTGLVFNYEKKKEDLLYEYIILPENAPARFYDRSTLWNEVEKTEKRKDSQLARYFIVALPRELGLIKNKNLLNEYIKKNFIKKGMCADIAIHNDKDNNNPHAHIMLTMRDVSEQGFLNKNREWNDKKNMEIWRRSWSVLVNKALRENDKTERITHLSFLKQKELIIQKAKERIEKNELAEAEKLINLYDDFKTKKPRKRKPRQQYLGRKKARATYEE